MSATGVRRATPDDSAFEPWTLPSPRPEDVLDGELDMRIAPVWMSQDRHRATGFWRCQPVRMRLDQAFDETLVLLEGRMTYSVDGEEPIEMRPGDAMVLAEGAKALFEVHEPVLTFWAVFHHEPVEC